MGKAGSTPEVQCRGGWVHGTGRVIAGGRIYTSQGGAPQYGVDRPDAEPETQAGPETTSLGLVVEKTFEIRESEPVGGNVRQYELRIDGQVVWDGLDEDRVNALAEALIAATDPRPKPPDE